MCVRESFAHPPFVLGREQLVFGLVVAHPAFTSAPRGCVDVEEGEMQGGTADAGCK